MVLPSEEKKHKKKHKRKTSEESRVANNDTSSSTTEIGGENSVENDTEEGHSDIEDIPMDETITITSGELKPMKLSHSTNELAIKNNNASLREMATMMQSEPDLLKYDQNPANHKQISATFFDELFEKFDKQTALSGDAAGEETDSNDGGVVKNNQRALQIIKENSEILERLLSRKTSPMCNAFENGTPQLATVAAPAQNNNLQSKQRKISQTSSNGSSGSNSVKSNITLQSNPATKPITFNPFPNSARTNRKPKEVGRKLGLYK